MQADTTAVARTVAQTLDVLAAKFGATGAHLWAVLIRQVYVEAIQAGVAVLLTGLLTWWMYRGLKLEIAKDRYANTENWTVGLVIGGCLFAVACICAMIFIPQIANPEYGALQHVLDAFKR
jgi:hypothetical protein